MRALIEKERRDERECIVFWVADIIPSLELAVERQLKRLEEGGTRETGVAQIGHLMGILAKVKAAKNSGKPKET